MSLSLRFTTQLYPSVYISSQSQQIDVCTHSQRYHNSIQNEKSTGLHSMTNYFQTDNQHKIFDYLFMKET